MFDKVVFAGGGHRCWWQAGFWEQLSGEIELHPRVIGGVSAGAATACLLYANDSKRALAWYERELKGMRTNINWFNLVRPGERLMPHSAIYRKALRALLGGENFRQLMWRAPEIRVQYSRLPPGMGPRRALLSGVVAYKVEKYWRGSLHPTFGQRMGFTHEVKRVQDCRSERELIDLLVASSCTPPFTPVETIDGLPCLDGGLVDNVPTGTVADVPGQTLVLTTRRYKSLAPVFARNGHVYVQPSREVAASSWDYTSPAKFQQTYDLGRRDAVEFLKTFGLGRYHDAFFPEPAIEADPMPVATGSALAGVTLARAPSDGGVADREVPASAGSDGEAPEGVGPASAVPEDAALNGAVPQEHPLMRATDGFESEGMEQGPEVLEPMSFLDESGKPGGGKAMGRSARREDGDDGEDGILDVNARLADYREPNEAGIAEDLSASQPAASEGQDRSGRSLRASRI